MNNFPVKFVFIGEVDHGKSSLIGRLALDTNSMPREHVKNIRQISKELGSETALAYFTDQLEEERKNNLTIDTTQIQLNSPGKNYVLIDTPGHLEFLKNMMTGVTHADAAILVIDATEGIKPQTQRHAFLAGFLGLRHIIIVVNKMDLASYSQRTFEEITQKLRSLLPAHTNQNISMVPASAKEAANISRRSSKTPWYKGPSLLEAMKSIRINQKKDSAPFCFPVQDVYKIGNENIIVGRIASGSVEQGQDITLLPSQKRATIRSLKVFDKETKKAQSRQSIGIALTTPLNVKRGDVLCDKKYRPQITTRFTGKVFWLSDKPLGLNQTILIRCATQETQCTVEKIEKKTDLALSKELKQNMNELKQNETAAIQFKANTALVVEDSNRVGELGRFVLQDNDHLLGVGIIK